MARLNEYVQLDYADPIKSKVKDMNYDFIKSINDTNLINELFKERQDKINRATELVRLLLLDIHKLNNLFTSQRSKISIAESVKKPNVIKKVKVIKKKISTKKKIKSTLKKKVVKPRAPTLKTEKDALLNLKKDLENIRKKITA